MRHPKDHRGRDIEKTCTVLNRRLTCVDGPHGKYISLEADPKHIATCIEYFKLGGCKRALTPRVKPGANVAGDHFESPALPSAMHKMYRSGVMRMAYVAQDRPDISESVKCLARAMAAPHVEHLENLKRLVRYCAGRPRAELRFHIQVAPSTVQIFVDSEWAGCTDTRRSTTGFVALVGGTPSAT